MSGHLKIPIFQEKPLKKLDHYVDIDDFLTKVRKESQALASKSQMKDVKGNSKTLMTILEDQC